jgi:biopolymer transport protein ExbB
MQVIYSKGLGLLDTLSTVNRTTGIFFDMEGKKVSGDVYRIGQIAAVGVSDTSIGLLVPAGEGRLKMWQEDAGMADYLSSDARPDTARLFIFESSVKSIDTVANESVLGYVNSGGVIAWVIVMLGALAAILILFRSWFLRTNSSDSEIILGEIKKSVAKHEIENAIDTCKKHSGSTARVVTATLRNLERDRDHLEDIVAENILYESPKLNRFGALIIVIAAVAPLLGLLGTVTGMISTFDVITQYGTGDPKLLSGGISTALVTTQLGLVVAIPALILGNLLSGWSNRIKDEMEKAALQIINIYDAPESIKKSDYLSLAEAV